MSITLRYHLAEAAKRAADVRARAAVLIGEGRHRMAFNLALQSLQAAVATEERRRPAAAPGLCEFFVEQIASFIEQLPAVDAVDAPRGDQ